MIRKSLSSLGNQHYVNRERNMATL